MAISQFVITATVTVPASGVSGDHGGGRFASGTAWGSLAGETFRRGQVVVADSAAGNGGASLLYTALQAAGAGLRAYVPGETDHSTVSN